MEITAQFNEALQSAIKDAGSINKLALNLNMRYGTLYKLAHNKSLYIREVNYNKLLPVLEPYLKQDNLKPFEGLESPNLSELDKVIINKLVKLSEVDKVETLKYIVDKCERERERE